MPNGEKSRRISSKRDKLTRNIDEFFEYMYWKLPAETFLTELSCLVRYCCGDLDEDGLEKWYNELYKQYK